MSEIAERYAKVAAEFTRRVEAVPADAWDNPAPCEGWVARDVVDHLAEWLSAFFFSGTWPVERPEVPSAKSDPVGAWAAIDAAVRRALGDPAIAGAVGDTRFGPAAFGETFDMIATPDVLIHTWDLARATGLDEHLDPDEVHAWVETMEPTDEMLRTSGQYGPRVAVPDDADEQTRLLAFLGRQP